MASTAPEILDLQFQGSSNIIAAFVLATDDGLMLVETGPHSCLPALEAALRDRGARLSDIRHVLLTHIHLDHAGAAWALAERGAQVYVHPRGLPHLLKPGRLMESAGRIYGKDMDRLWGEMRPIAAENLRPVAHKQDLMLGGVSVKAWHSPGHAYHHIAWQIGPSLFCGDVAGVAIGEGPVFPPCPPPSIDLEAWFDSMELLSQRKVKDLYLTHFGCVPASADHWQALRIKLRRWADWIEDKRQRGLQAKEMVPLFEEMVARQIEGSGGSAATRQQYELANPAWMSVYGLDRYWRLKEKRGD